MLTFELLEHENGRYIYAFYPNGNLEHPGIISINENGDKEILSQSDVDVKQYYAGHALFNIPVGKSSGSIAWC